jgi:protein-disulfide isomerase
MRLWLLRQPPVALMLLLLAIAPAVAQSQPPAPALSPEQTKAVEQVIQDYLLNHPDFMMQVLQKMQQHMAEHSKEQTRQTVLAKHDELLADADSEALGNPDADVTIVEFFDYRCPYCKQIQATLESIVKTDPKVRIVYKEFPILGPMSLLASHAALAARRQGKYLAFHDALMEWRGQIDDKVVFDLAKTAGLDIDKLKADMNDASVQAIIDRNMALAQALHIDATPGFVVGDQTVVGADIESVKQAVLDARKPG